VADGAARTARDSGDAAPQQRRALLLKKLRPLPAWKTSRPSLPEMRAASKVTGPVTAHVREACDGSLKKSFDSLSARERLKSEM
jgi:hypothetical protein